MELPQLQHKSFSTSLFLRSAPHDEHLLLIICQYHYFGLKFYVRYKNCKHFCGIINRILTISLIKRILLKDSFFNYPINWIVKRKALIVIVIQSIRIILCVDFHSKMLSFHLWLVILNDFRILSKSDFQ